MALAETEAVTEIEVVKTVGRIHEVNILLNSNIQDALECAQESKAATNQLVTNLDHFYKHAEQKSMETREEMTKKLSQLESNVSRSADKTLESVAGHYQLLEEAGKLLQQEQRQTQDKLTQLTGQIKKSFEAAALGNVQLHKDMIAQLGTIIDTHSQAVQSTQRKLSDKLAEVSETINYTNEKLKQHEEAMAARFEEQTKLLRKSQRKWFIWLIVLIILGYFF